MLPTSPLVQHLPTTSNQQANIKLLQNTSTDLKLTNDSHGPSTSTPNRLQLNRIPRLLLLGYPSKEAQRQYEMQQDWVRFHAILLLKLENIAIVSGLLLAANTNFLVSGELGRMTYVSVAASTCLCLLSMVFDLVCLWSLIGVHPTRLKFLVQQTHLFYYLYGTPSLFGGASALSFFVAVGSWTWLDEATQKYGWGGKICSVFLGVALTVNAGSCFFLGASTDDILELHINIPEERNIPASEVHLPPSHPVPNMFPESIGDGLPKTH